jgi:hypothetical protein
MGGICCIAKFNPGRRQNKTRQKRNGKIWTWKYFIVKCGILIKKFSPIFSPSLLFWIILSHSQLKFNNITKASHIIWVVISFLLSELSYSIQISHVLPACKPNRISCPTDSFYKLLLMSPTDTLHISLRCTSTHRYTTRDFYIWTDVHKWAL